MAEMCYNMSDIFQYWGFFVNGFQMNEISRLIRIVYNKNEHYKGDETDEQGGKEQFLGKH